MTDKEQIEGIMTAVPQTIIAYDGNPKGQHLYGEQRKQIAEALYNAGYRKESETAKEIFNKLIKIAEDEFKGSLPFGVLKAWALEYGVEIEQ